MDQPMMDTAVIKSRDQVGLFVDEAMAPARTQPVAAAELIPPAGLFKPIRYAPLHIFVSFVSIFRFIFHFRFILFGLLCRG